MGLKSQSVVAILVFVVSGALGADIRFFASASASDGSQPAAIPTVPVDQPLYLWADTDAPGQTTWSGMQLTALNASGRVYNTISDQTGVLRWNDIRDIAGEDYFDFNPTVGVLGIGDGIGLGTSWELGGDLYDPQSGNYLLGFLEPVEEGPITLSVTAAVTKGGRKGSDRVAVVDSPFTANTNIVDDPVTATIAIATEASDVRGSGGAGRIPEPGTLAGLALAGVFGLRRLRP